MSRGGGRSPRLSSLLLLGAFWTQLVFGVIVDVALIVVVVIRPSWAT